MAKRSISSMGKQAVTSGFLDEIGSGERTDYDFVKLENIKQTLEYIAGRYVEEISKAIEKKDASSSGAMKESIKPLEVEVMGSVYTVAIEANKYLSYVDEGVDGWANSRGSKYKFKTKGVNPDGEMVKSVMEWLTREGSIGKLTLRPISKRERRQQKITDTSKRAAMRAAFMIKRQGIIPKGFMALAKRNMDKEVKKEFGAALKLDIQNNLV